MVESVDTWLVCQQFVRLSSCPLVARLRELDGLGGRSLKTDLWGLNPHYRYQFLLINIFMEEKRKFWHFGRNSICLGVYYFPIIQIGIEFSESVTIRIGAFVNFYIAFDFWRISSWIHKLKMHHRALEASIGFTHGLSLSFNLMSDTMGWKKGDWKGHCAVTDRLKGKMDVSKKIIEEMDILIPMPEKSYEAHAVLADWTWKYPRWFSQTIRRCEIEIPGGIPCAGKGENSWDCGDDATFGSTSGKVSSIAEAVGNLIGRILNDRVRYGGWKDWHFIRDGNSK